MVCRREVDGGEGVRNIPIPIRIVVVFSLLLALMFSTSSVHAAIDCCISSTYECSEGQNTASTCAANGGTPYTASLCTAVQACTQGCCCVRPTAPNQERNNDETFLQQTVAQCQALGSADFQFNVLPPGLTCVEVCDAIPDSSQTATDTYTVTGKVLEQGEQGASNTPLANATVFIPHASSVLQATTSADGSFSITNVPELNATITVTSAGCHPLSQAFSVAGANTNLGQMLLSCDLTQCTPTVKPQIVAAVVEASENVSLTITADSAQCGAPSEYIVTRKDLTNGGSIKLPKITHASVMDTTVAPNTQYRYSIQAVYPSLGEFPELTQRNYADITTGDIECMRAPALSWCNNGLPGDASSVSSAVVSCAQGNILKKEFCQANNICKATGSSLKPHECVPEPSCQACAGPFGMLKQFIYSIFYGGQAFNCNHPTLQGVCFSDQTDSIHDTYKSCGDISICEQYDSQDACSANPCATQGSCSWIEVFPEFGKGVCQTTQTNNPSSCDTCEELYGICNKDLCQALGEQTDGSSECYYSENTDTFDSSVRNSLCTHEEDFACAFYDSQQDCIGTAGQNPLQINVTYSGKNRVSGSNALVTPSNDLFNIGTCRWKTLPSQESSTGGYCYKDADGYNPNEQDDCLDSGAFAQKGIECYSDATPPTTSILTSQEILPAHELSGISFVVSDNFYSPQEIQTYFCLASPNLPALQSTCYPTHDISQLNALLPNLELNTQGTLFLRYYSVDPSGNLEPVQQTNITIIELGYPRMLPPVLY